MFVYTVYPRVPSTGKKAARRTEPVSRVSPVHPVERIVDIRYGDVVQQKVLSPYEAIDVQPSKSVTSRDHREPPVGEAYVQDMFPDILPFLLEWRQPKIFDSTGYIRERLDTLHNMRLKRKRLR